MDLPWRNVLLGELHVVEDDQRPIDLHDCSVVDPWLDAEALARDGRGSPVGAAWARPPPLGALHLLLNNNICIV